MDQPDVGRFAKLTHPGKRVRVVMDTDTFNEIDDQFAVTYAWMSPDKIQLEALYAAPFHNDLSSGPMDGMEKSYHEILRLLGHLNAPSDDFVFRGAPRYLPAANTPVDSDAARDLVRRARASSPDDPLYVVAVAAPTNVASAILLEPAIVDRIVIVWLGGHALHWPDTREFNLAQDIHASRLLLDSGVPLILVPCMGVSSHLITSLPEIRASLKDCGGIGDYLVETFANCQDDHFGRSRVIWDIAAVAYLINPDWVPSGLVSSPVLNDSLRWSCDASRHPIRIATHIYRDPVFTDLFRKIRTHSTTAEVADV